MQNIESASFSLLVEHNSGVSPVLNPTGTLLASAIPSQLQVWDIDVQKIKLRFEYNTTIDFITWSPDSLLLCFGTLKNSVEVRNVESPQWKCKINGCLSFESILWCPDSHHLLIVSELYMKVTIHSLVSSISSEIGNLKAIEHGVIFSYCEKYMAIALRINFEDNIGIYNIDSWEPLKIFCIETSDMAAVSFSPKDLVLAVLGSVSEYKILFYSIDGRILGKYELETSLNIRNLSWHPSGKYIAIGDFTGQVKILDTVNVNVVSFYKHDGICESMDVTVYKTSLASESESLCWKFDEVVKERPLTLQLSNSEKKGKSKKLCYGIQKLQFSSCGRYIASVDASNPKVVFIYDMHKKSTCSIVIRELSIKSFSWHPKNPFLIVCSSSCSVDVWSPKFSLQFMSPFQVDFAVSEAVWNLQKNLILLSSTSHFSLLHFPESETCSPENVCDT